MPRLVGSKEDKKIKSQTLSGSPQVKKRKRNTLERSLMLAGLVVAVLVIISFSTLYDKVVETLVPKETVYGVWVEQDVASYATQRIVIGSEGISINGGVVATQFQFDGRHLVYKTGEKEFKYLMLNEQNSEMRLLSDKPYNPTYRLLEKPQNNLR